jgi:hypothetical protein
MPARETGIFLGVANEKSRWTIPAAFLLTL